jgi:tripartite-type tricarboxylate transporter receptor subunit TctC
MRPAAAPDAPPIREANMTVSRALTAALLVCGVALHAAHAQSFPDRVIKVIVPFTPGSPVDAAARVITQHVQTRLGQSMVVENRPGAGTTLGIRAVMAAPPDGYTLLFIGPNLAYTPVLYPSLNFDPLKSLAPVATVAAWSHVMVVAPAVPARTVRELVAHMKANPGKLTYGYGLATTPHILAETFRQATGADFAGVPYRGGEQARADLLGGRIDINMAPTSNLLAIIQDSRARPLAFTGPKRSADLPEVPTMIESGYPTVGYDPDVWVGFLAPAGTPAEVVNKVNAAVNESLKSDDMKAVLAKLGWEPMSTTPGGFTSFIAGEVKKWPPLLQAAGLKAE